MHASLPVRSERLHDRDDPRVLAQPLGGKHAPVDVPWGRARPRRFCLRRSRLTADGTRLAAVDARPIGCF